MCFVKYTTAIFQKIISIGNWSFDFFYTLNSTIHENETKDL